MAEKQKEQQKLWLILFQLKAVRARVNSLAAQYFAFSTLALIIAAAAIIITAALLLSPLLFLLVGSVVAIVALLGVGRVTRSTLRSLASPLKAAALADERAGLKGRLLTIQLLAEAPRRSGLWPYLVEDTYGRRNDFEPAKIESRWFSRSVLTLLGVCLAALLLVRFARWRSDSPPVALGAMPGEASADIGSLDIQPADPALQPNAEVYADPATLRKLADKLAAAQANANNSSLSRWMGKARDLAGQLQHEITGNQEHWPPLRLRLTDNSPAGTDRPHGRGNAGGSNQQGISPDNSPGGNSGTEGGQSPPQETLPAQQADQLAQNGRGYPGQPGSDASQPQMMEPGGSFAGSAGGGGSSHGSGTDPEHLFGPASAQPLGSNSFKITIDAQPSDESSSSGAPAYIPPKVRVPLNNEQLPDEPIARASVPVGDQMSVKRVFER